MSRVVEERQRDRERQQREQVEVQQRQRPAEVDERQHEQHAQREPDVQRVDVPAERARVAARHRPRDLEAGPLLRAPARCRSAMMTCPISCLAGAREVAHLPAERGPSGRRRRRSRGIRARAARIFGSALGDRRAPGRATAGGPAGGMLDDRHRDRALSGAGVDCVAGARGVAAVAAGGARAQRRRATLRRGRAACAREQAIGAAVVRGDASREGNGR